MIKSAFSTTTFNSLMPESPESADLVDRSHNPQRVKVLYIAGCGRTGSTLLGNALGQVEGFTHVGELLELWGNLAPERPPCGCQAPVAACKMWKDVLKEAYGGVNESLIALMREFSKSETPGRAFRRTMTSRGLRALQRRVAKPVGELEKLYLAIQRVFNCEVIVDSSKKPMYLYILQQIGAIDLYVLHLVRDPRSWAHAFLQRKVREGHVLYMKPLSSSLRWSFRNSLVEAMSGQFQNRHWRLRYEDFVANPGGSLRGILNIVGATSSSLPLQDDHTINLKIQHTVSGNPNRFLTGMVELREDHSWETEMKSRDRMLINALTWPLLIKYGYPIAPRLRADEVTARKEYKQVTS